MKYVPKELKETADISRGDQSRRAFLRNSLAVVLVLLVSYVILGFVADLVAENISEETEAKMLNWTPDESSVPEDDPAFARTKAIFERLVQADDLRPLPYVLFALDWELPNAVAVPGGGVGVTKGLLERMESERGLALVLAHELGHHQSRHCLKRLGRLLIVRAGFSFVFGSSGPSGVDSALSLAESGYSRDQEREADRFGMRLVHAVYGDLDGSLEFFEKMHAEFGQSEHAWSAFAASHPLTTERLDTLKDLKAELETSSP